MPHDHSAHSHQYTPVLSGVNRAFVVGIVLNLLFVLLEAGAGFWTDSLALLTDAGHNLSDVASLALALLAYRLAKLEATETYTYGYQKTTILVALVNAVILLIAIGGIGWEAAHRFFYPEAMPGEIIAVVAGVGIIINTITAFLFFRDKEKDLNVKGAYLHLAADAAVSAGVVIAGMMMYYTQWYFIDSIISFVIMLIIFMSTWQLLKETIRLSLDGVPHNVESDKIKPAALQVTGVIDIHHIHVWAMSTTRNALTAHVVVNTQHPFSDIERIKRELKHELEHLNIQHATLEIECQGSTCEEC